MTHVHDAVIVGAGFGGMGAAIQLRRLGYDDLVILEREDDLGGTWHVNHYPGLAVDIPSSTYSFSFEPNPRWSRIFAPGAELKAYATHLADKYDLRRHMRFGTAVTGAEWDEGAACWDVTLADGTRARGRHLVKATGFLSQPKLPDIAGIDTFSGDVVHTTEWDDTVPLDGRRIAIIGTGATAVQLIPELAEVADHLTVYQRTPAFVMPRVDARIPRPVRTLFARLPVTQRLTRLVTDTTIEVLMGVGVLRFRRFPWANRAVGWVGRRFLAHQVPDPDLRAKLTARYDLGCKRPTWSNTYFRTFTRPHVDLETTPIDHVDGTGIVTTDGNRVDVDVLVLATGFDLYDANFPVFPVRGRDGLDLGTWWRANRFASYEGISVPGFPNFLAFNCPYSYVGLSYFVTLENQMRHLDRLLTATREQGAQVFEPRREAADAYVARMVDRLGDSVFLSGSCASARSYYFTKDGDVVLVRPTSMAQARREASRFPIDDYEYRRVAVAAGRGASGASLET